MSTFLQSPLSQRSIDLENQFGTHNYHPLPVVLERGLGAKIWDVDGKEYFDFLSAYSAVNQGHSHPKILKALTDQASKLTLTSRAFYNSNLGDFSKFLTEYFQFDRMLPMNSGAEAVETAIKVCRKWAYQKKNIPENQAIIVVCSQNFHGRTTTIVGFSTDPDSTRDFGPFTPGFQIIPYNDLPALEEALKNPNVAGFLFEPIQGEAGVMVPDAGYLEKVRELCTNAGVLMMADEVQTGIARTGQLLATCADCSCSTRCERKYAAKPDLLILGKALSGGIMPVSAVLASHEILLCIHPGEHGSTFGGNPLACAVATSALNVIEEEELAQKAKKRGVYFRQRMEKLMSDFPKLFSLVRGKGLLNAVVIRDDESSKTAWNFCVMMMQNGVLAKPTHGNIIRFAPPLVISEIEMTKACDNIEKTTLEFVQAYPQFQ